MQKEISCPKMAKNYSPLKWLWWRFLLHSPMGWTPLAVADDQVSETIMFLFVTLWLQCIDVEMKLNKLFSLIDTDDSTLHCDDQLCSIYCISPAPFNRSPVGSCLDSTYVDDGSTSLESNKLDSFFDLSVLQNEQSFKYVKRTVV